MMKAKCYLALNLSSPLSTETLDVTNGELAGSSPNFMLSLPIRALINDRTHICHIAHWPCLRYSLKQSL